MSNAPREVLPARSIENWTNMKRLTVAAAALAAGMLTIVAQSGRADRRPVPQHRSERPAATDRKRWRSAAAEKRRRQGAASATPAWQRPARQRLQQGAKPARRKPEVDGLASTRRRPRRSRRVRGQPQGDRTHERQGSAAARPVGRRRGKCCRLHHAGRRATRRAYGVPVSLAHAVISIESNYRPNMRRQRRRDRPDADQAGDGADDGLQRLGKRPVRSRDQHQIRHEISRPWRRGSGRHHLRHDPEIQCRPCREAHEPGFGRLLPQGQACRWPAIWASPASMTPSVTGFFGLRFQARTAFIRPASRPGGRTREAERLRVRKVRAPWKHGAG